jgi:hypothetical protein
MVHPFAGSRMLRDILRREGHTIGRKRVSRLMTRMGIEALYRKSTTSQRHPAHSVYLPIAQPSDRTPQSRVGGGHHVHPDGARRGVPICRDGLEQPERCWRGAFPIRKPPIFVWRDSRRPSTHTAGPISSIPIRAANSPVWRSPAYSKPTASRSAWTAQGAARSRRCRAALEDSQIRRGLSAGLRDRCRRPSNTQQAISRSTTNADRTRHWAAQHRMSVTLTTCLMCSMQHRQIRKASLMTSGMSKQTGPPSYLVAWS